MTERPPMPPGTTEKPGKAPWLSRKWWACLIGVIAGLITHFTGIEVSIEAVLLILGPIIAYIFGEAWVDCHRL